MMAKRDKITAFMKDVINEIPASGTGSNTSKTISDADRKRIDASVVKALGGAKKPRIRPDVGAIERGNRAAKRTAQDLATQNFEDGGRIADVRDDPSRGKTY